MNEQNIQENSSTIEQGPSKTEVEEAAILHNLRELERASYENGYTRGKAGQRKLKPNDITFVIKVKIITLFVLSVKKIPDKDLSKVLILIYKMRNKAFNKGCINGYQEFKAS